MAYLLFVSKPTGYELHEREGEPPAVGEEVEDGEVRLQVTKIASSFLALAAQRAQYERDAPRAGGESVPRVTADTAP